jgi:hypothetical protein
MHYHLSLVSGREPISYGGMFRPFDFLAPKDFLAFKCFALNLIFTSLSVKHVLVSSDVLVSNILYVLVFPTNRHYNC